MPATPDLAIRDLALPSRTCLASPGHSLPYLTCQAIPHRCMPQPAWPYHTCHALPSPASACQTLEQWDLVIEAGNLGLPLVTAPYALVAEGRVDFVAGQAQAPVDVPAMCSGRGNEHDPGPRVVEPSWTPITLQRPITAPHLDILDATVTGMTVVLVGTYQAQRPGPYRPRENKHPLLRG